MRLRELLKNILIVDTQGNLEIDVKHITAHSKQVSPGSLFIALKGLHNNGQAYIGEAIIKGAAAILTEEIPLDSKNGVTYIKVGNAREAAAKVAAAFYQHPAEKLTLIGITGTNGKTTTSFLIASILEQAQRRPGIIGTIKYQYAGKTIPASLTTPDSLELQKLFHEMLTNDITDVVMEVSSHSLFYKRVEGCKFKLAIFTNLSRDHLDFHENMEAYFNCKKELFTYYLAPEGVAVINADDTWGQRLLKAVAHHSPYITYGLSTQTQVRAQEVNFSLDGTKAIIQTPEGNFSLVSSLIGQPNLYNLLAATAAAIALGIPLSVIKSGLEKIGRVKGRMERFSGKGIEVIIDYAHTPDALKQALTTLRPFCQGKLITVFGCGGNRDRGKRPIMGEIASELADMIIITNDNPRNESSRQIIQDIEMGIKKEIPYCIIPDRQQAIAWAIKYAKKGDVVLIAGKGHENYQIVGDKKYHLDDREEVIKNLVMDNEE
ncbi:MAG: UDP-N-acetylmuramoyl-L-alanyl-D-glutamate--2,6-diaminopimelate ligase [Candidatus Desulfofervidaceae bacterium]|nr:UDP-N-acetylmuramoyl-L-alanyl-D-glutamate--2,6-diaminopimelate ligase [Candidatus Desulfofervidaceae bacterium]MDL1969629.1 UDP-N-acetylmuramoyl-L-alanyl-D-glutamate--2,6-diaminopimelate ligase [Candidatus Desulfofervidaceae bacterium]